MTFFGRPSLFPFARAPRGAFPGFRRAAIQRIVVGRFSRSAGPAGVSKEIFLFGKRWSQAAARVWELEQQGFQIAHLQRDGETYVRYVLESEPLKLRPTDGSDWYERITGKPRTGNPDNVPDLPLFPGGDS